MSSEKPYFLYVVKCSDNSYYTGITTDLDRRVKEHNGSKKGAKYTRSRRPVIFMYSKVYPCRSTASKAEYRFKKLKRKEKEDIVMNTRVFE